MSVFFMSIFYLSTCLYSSMSMYVYFYRYICLRSIYLLSIRLSIFISSSVYLFLSIYTSIYLSTDPCLSIWGIATRYIGGLVELLKLIMAILMEKLIGNGQAKTHNTHTMYGERSILLMRASVGWFSVAILSPSSQRPARREQSSHVTGSSSWPRGFIMCRGGCVEVAVLKWLESEKLIGLVGRGRHPPSILNLVKGDCQGESAVDNPSILGSRKTTSTP